MQYLLSKQLFQISKSYNNLIIAELLGSDLRTDLDVAILTMLHSSQHQMNQKEIAALLNMDASRVSGLVFALVQKGYLITERNAADRRQHYVSLTAKGSKLIPAIQLAIESVNGIISHHLDDHSLYVFYDVLRQMEANLLASAFPGR